MCDPLHEGIDWSRRSALIVIFNETTKNRTAAQGCWTRRGAHMIQRERRGKALQDDTSGRQS